MLSNYFRHGRYQDALEAYAAFACREDWRISYRAELYKHAQDAFQSSLSEDAKERAFSDLYNGLKAYFGVFRNATGGYWTAEETWQALTLRCRDVSREGGITLETVEGDWKGAADLTTAIQTLSRIKRKSEYPHMPAAKFLHFYNPGLFPIYDRKVIWEQVLLGPFASEWRSVCNRMGIILRETTGKFNVTYTRWAAEIIKEADPGLMPYFATWFREQAEIDDGRLIGLETYYATAFEFIAIGAMKIEIS